MELRAWLSGSDAEDQRVLAHVVASAPAQHLVVGFPPTAAPHLRSPSSSSLCCLCTSKRETTVWFFGDVDERREQTRRVLADEVAQNIKFLFQIGMVARPARRITGFLKRLVTFSPPFPLAEPVKERYGRHHSGHLSVKG